MSNHSKSHTRVKFSDQLTVLARLQEVCKREGEAAVYQDGWDDERVAQVVRAQYGIACTRFNVEGIRIQMIGKIARSAAPDARQRELAERLGRLEEAFSQQAARLKHLEDSLGLTLAAQ